MDPYSSVLAHRGEGLYMDESESGGCWSGNVPMVMHTNGSVVGGGRFSFVVPISE